MSKSVQCRSYAKINFYLDVLGRRRDDYHNIETIFQTVSLFDELAFVEDASQVSLTCSASELGPPESNLAHRAACLLRDRYHVRQGVKISLEKRIPIAAGLAGGSGNAAAALVALNVLWDLGLSTDRLCALGLELGSDVPYCVVGGAMAATGRGENMTPLPSLPETWCVLLHPDLSVSTRRIYNSPLLERSPETPFAGRTQRFRRSIHALVKGDFANAVFNRMERPVFAEHPVLADARQRLLDAGCVAAAMSGSGPTVFGVCTSHHHAMSVAGVLSDFRSTVVSTVGIGVDLM